MPFPRLRIPDTYQDAVTKVVGSLTAQVCADTVGKSASLVRAWTDPDRDCVPSLVQAEALDRAMICHALEPAILPVFARRIQAVRQQEADPGEPKDRFIRLVKALGDVSGELRAAEAPDSPGETDITPVEASQILGAMDDMDAEMQRLRRSLLSCVMPPLRTVGGDRRA